MILGVRTVELEKRLHCVKVPEKFSVSTREMRKNNRAYDNGEKFRTKSDYENNKKKDKMKVSFVRKDIKNLGEKKRHS